MKGIKSLAAVFMAAAAMLIHSPAAIAQNADSTATCTEGRFAVGGYPHTGRVPANYTGVYTPGGIFPWENGGYNHGQETGARNVVAALDEYAATCPDSEIYVVGHSYGAGVIHTALATVDTREYANDVHVYITGNPRHPGGVESSWRWLSWPGMKFRGPGVSPRNLAEFTDLCHPRDIICSTPSILNVPKTIDNIAGYLTGAHGYPALPGDFPR